MPGTNPAGPPRVAYLGPEGTFSEEAALIYRGDRPAELLPFASIPAVISATETRMADEGIVPIENSLEGPVLSTLDILVHESALRIKHELVVPIFHYLLAKPGTKAEEAQVLFSHPQAIGQCRRFIDRCLPKVEVVAALSTAKAVAEMMAYSAPAVAIATKRAGLLHGAEVLAENIQDQQSNLTRFVVLAPEDAPPTGRDKTSLCFTVPGDREPGTLCAALQEFGKRGISMSKIESRPTKEGLGTYIFLVDIEGHRTDPLVIEALDAMKPKTSLLKIFGSYPRY
ncbi:MAG: prephenate dehydratase [Dehalococcoidales bacterium]|nr:prephenate dehydratase [Dehalococcoidales bacterium]